QVPRRGPGGGGGHQARLGPGPVGQRGRRDRELPPRRLMPAMSVTPVTVGELLDDAEAQIKACEAIELWRPYMARLEAASLLGFVLGHDPEQSEEVVPAAAHRRFDGLIARRLTGEPAALIVGSTTFRG